ncbi:MAG: stage III sporulation protein AD [Clostridia bacterium]|nr:stage III sporulation protein AD [Clostridia bacterium]
MTELLKIVAIALVTVFAHMLIKQTKPEIAILISIVGSIVIITMIISSMSGVIAGFHNIFIATKIDSSLLTPLMKIVAIGYIAEFGANICADAGAGSVADKVLFAAKIIILMISLPIINNVLNMVVDLL